MTDKYVSAKCPQCGKFMDRVVATVVKQVAGTTVPVGSTVVAHVCVSPECNKA